MEGKASERILNISMSEKEMNRLPMPYRGTEFLKQYNFEIQGVNVSTIFKDNGCPMKCAFCEDTGSKVRLYNPSNINMQIKDVLSAGFKGVIFFYDIFVITKKKVMDLFPL